MQYSKVCYIGTVYSLLIFLVLCKKEEVEQSFFFFSDSVPQVIRDKFKNKKVLFRKSSALSVFFYFIYLRFYFKRKVGDISKCEIWGQDHLPYSSFFLKARSFTLIEDGTGTYKEFVPLKFNFAKECVRKLLTGVDMYTISERSLVSKVIFTGILSIPKYLEKKSFVVDLNQRIKGCDKGMLFDKFCIDISLIEKLKEKKILLITQTLSEENYISEEEKLIMYKSIIDKYATSQLVIKPHPSEKTNYGILFPKIEVLPSHIPIQLILLFGFKPQIIATVSSTAGLNLDPEVKLDWYGSSLNHKLAGIVPEMFSK